MIAEMKNSIDGLGSKVWVVSQKNKTKMQNNEKQERKEECRRKSLEGLTSE